MGGALVIGAAALSRAGTKTYALIVVHSGPGTLDISDGTHSYPGPTQITVKASPASGYQANWNVNGVDVAQGVNVYSVLVKGIASVQVSFVLAGPQAGPPAAVKALGSAATLENFRFWFNQATGPIAVEEDDQNWRLGKAPPSLMAFQVVDAAGRGVPNIVVNVYPDINPDATAYKTWLLFQDPLGQWPPYTYTSFRPLVLTTDATGVVQFLVWQMYGAEDPQAEGGLKELSQGAGVYADKMTFPGPFPYTTRVLPVWNGLAAGLGWWWTGGGGGGTIVYPRIIRCDIAQTIYSTLQTCQITYGAKWGAP